MMEHIFRNINDIRVFDVFFVEACYRESIDVDEIMDYLEYGEAEHIQIEDSVVHLVRHKILEEVKVEYPSYGGCRTCSYLDRLKLPRVGEHKSHQPYSTSKVTVIEYKLCASNLTIILLDALYEHTKMMAEEGSLS